jgi:hypothetical protein
MNTTVADLRLWQQWKQRERFTLLAAFEDSETCTRAKKFCQDLSRLLGTHCRIIQHVWVFSTFRLRELREIAAEEASVSDLVVISAHQAASLPEEVKLWIDLWLRQKGHRPAVLLALLDPVSGGHPSPIRRDLQNIAQRAGVEFLVSTDEGFGFQVP